MMTYEDALANLCRENNDIIVMTAENRAAIRNLPSPLGPRFIDVGICEQTMIGAAAGLALRGRIPVCHSLATFLTLRAFEFIRTDVGIARLPVKLVGAVPGFLSDGNGPTHQAIEDVALMRGIPHMQIFCPSDGDELVEMLPAIVEGAEPAYVRFNARPAVVRHHESFSVGKAEQFGCGKDVALLTYGFLAGEVEEARKMLEERSVSARTLNLRTLSPIDEEAILRAARETGLLVTIEDHFRIGGLYSIVAELLVSSRTSARVVPLALDRKWFRPGLLEDVLSYEGFTGAKIARRVQAALVGETT